MEVKISKWGNSLAVRLPKELAEKLKLVEGRTVDMTIDKGLSVLPAAKSRYPTLEEMVAEARRLGPQNEPAFEDWGEDMGAEIIDDDYCAAKQ
jgi:antitoxin MazE